MLKGITRNVTGGQIKPVAVQQHWFMFLKIPMIILTKQLYNS